MKLYPRTHDTALAFIVFGQLCISLAATDKGGSEGGTK